jgi:vanillate O-demethylase ferredoxin subunit
VLQLRIEAIAAEARDVMQLELVDAGGAQLPPFEPGAHLALQLPGGMVRHYSLVNDCAERHRYVVAVGRVREGRGGSNHVHSALREGMVLPSDPPANNFRLDPSASSYLFVAGGIGITPILCMLRWCQAHRKPWRLVYAARSRQRMAFYEELRAFNDAVRLHADDERGGPLDVAALLASHRPDEQIYCCGPAALMQAVERGTATLPQGTAHFEWFSAPVDTVQPAPEPDGFWIDLKRSGTALHVPADRSILDVLEASGHDVPFSCREGLCGTCETVVCEGEPDHRDYVYSAAQREGLRSMLICVSRALSPRLALDI